MSSRSRSTRRSREKKYYGDDDGGKLERELSRWEKEKLDEEDDKAAMDDKIRGDFDKDDDDDDDDEDAVEDITARFTSLIESDPKFRLQGHRFLGRRYEYTEPMEDIGVDTHRGTVIGFISKNDLDSDGNVAFTSGITGKAEDLFHLCGVDENGEDYTFDLEESQMQGETFTWVDGNDGNEDDDDDEEEEGLESGDEEIIDGTTVEEQDDAR